MLVLVADPELKFDWPEGLRRAGWALDRGGDDANDAAELLLLGVDGVRDPVRFLELRKRHEGIPIVVVTRVPPSALPEIREDVAAFVLPAFDGAPPAGPRPRVMPRLVPATTIGPPEGLTGRFHRSLAGVLRGAGIPVSLRSDMQAWLASFAAWATPLGAAMMVAFACTGDLRRSPDLIALAARAGRERIALLRRAGRRLESRARWLENLTESSAIEAYARLADCASARVHPPWLPSAAEVLVASRFFQCLADLRFVATPSANVLDDLVGELCAREDDRVRTSLRSE